MTTISCKRCGLSFETEAVTNTRCRRCRTVVRVPTAARTPGGHTGLSEHTFGVLLLGCGHLSVVVIHPGKSLARLLKRAEWECPDTGAPVESTRVVAVLSETEWDAMTEEAFDRLVSEWRAEPGLPAGSNAGSKERP